MRELDSPRISSAVQVVSVRGRPVALRSSPESLFPADTRNFNRPFTAVREHGRVAEGTQDALPAPLVRTRLLEANTIRCSRNSKSDTPSTAALYTSG